MRAVGMPTEIAACTKICSRKDSTTLRTRRTTRGSSGTVMAMITVKILAPFSEIRAIASSRPGIAIRPSMKRMMTASTFLLKPAMIPITKPKKVLITATETPTTREICPPATTRAKMSRPNMSVPKSRSPLGGFNRLIGFIRNGSTVNIGPMNDNKIIARSSTPPISTLGCRRKYL